MEPCASLWEATGEYPPHVYSIQRGGMGKAWGRWTTRARMTKAGTLTFG